MHGGLKKILIINCALLIANCIFAADVSITEQQKQKQTKQKQKQQTKETPATSFVRKLSNALEKGSVEQALALFNNIPNSLKDDVDLQKLRISLLISAERYDEAKNLIAELDDENSLDIELKELKMVLAKATKNASEKSAAIKEIISLDPYNSSANTELGQEQVLRKKYKLAKNYYAKALQGDSKNLDALFGYGQTSYYLNDIDNARDAFKKILALDPQNATAYSYLGKLCAEDENYKLAEEYVLKAIELDNTQYDFYMDLGTYQRFRGKFKDAEKAWTNAIKINPNYFLAYAYRAGLYDEQDIYNKALDDYRMVIKTNPEYYFAYESIGILAWRIENYDEARGAFEKAYSHNPKNISYPLMIAACCYKASGNVVKASVQVKPFLQKTMKVFPYPKKVDLKTKIEMEQKREDTIEYLMLRLYHDLGPANAENLIMQKLQQEEDKQKKGKMTFYMALYDEIMGRTELAKKIYGEISSLQSPMFFEYRLAEWKVK